MTIGRICTLGVLGAIVAGCATLAPEQGVRLAPGEGNLTRQILLTIPQDNTEVLGLLGDPANRYVLRRGYRASPAVERTLNEIANRYGIRRVTGWPIPSLGVYCEVYEVEVGLEIDELLDRLANDSRIDLAQHMNVFETLLSRYDDPYVDLQASMGELSMELAHEFATGRGVTVAVIDSQIDSGHPDLRGKIGIDRDLVAGRGPARTGELHGTAVAGIIASIANNTEGIVGVAPDVSIAALRACWSVSIEAARARCSSLSLARALEVALNIEPEIINLSLAGPDDPLLGQLLDEAIERGIIVVAARPDSADDGFGFPSTWRRVIAAQSIHQGTNATPFLLSAPGNEIITTTPGAGYAFLSGNSFAAAHVSGVIALILERNPHMSVDLVASLLSRTTTGGDRGELSINACRALAELTRTTAADGCRAAPGAATFLAR